MLWAQAAALAACLLLFGCQPETDEAAAGPLPPKVVFEGTIDPKLVGHWATDDGKSVLDLKLDGHASILSVTASPSGDQKTTL
ncbi:MAG TPA: hypothetical protein VG820_12320, partial [Fimbriimonadaceae bacterium]|nr:hypothetical protein [Fimbriimonadaceae bacterium]